MNRTASCALAGAGVFLLCAGALSCFETVPGPATPAPVDFVSEVKPILQERCVMCHNRATLPKRTSFESGVLAMRGDASGPVILPGDPAGSRLMAAVNSPDFHETAMPPVSLRVSDEEKEIMERWIEEGADWPSGAEGELVPDMIPLE